MSKQSMSGPWEELYINVTVLLDSNNPHLGYSSGLGLTRQLYGQDMALS